MDCPAESVGIGWVWSKSIGICQKMGESVKYMNKGVYLFIAWGGKLGSGIVGVYCASNSTCPLNTTTKWESIHLWDAFGQNNGGSGVLEYLLLSPLFVPWVCGSFAIAGDMEGTGRRVECSWVWVWGKKTWKVFPNMLCPLIHLHCQHSSLGIPRYLKLPTSKSPTCVHWCSANLQQKKMQIFQTWQRSLPW